MRCFIFVLLFLSSQVVVFVGLLVLRLVFVCRGGVLLCIGFFTLFWWDALSVELVLKSRQRLNEKPPST